MRNKRHQKRGRNRVKIFWRGKDSRRQNCNFLKMLLFIVQKTNYCFKLALRDRGPLNVITPT